MTDRIPTTAPDPTAIEEALLRIKVAANIVETIAEATARPWRAARQHLDPPGRRLGARRPVVQHLIDQGEGRAAA